MNVTKGLCLALAGACLILAAPTERAQALSLINPAAANAVQQKAQLATTEVHWRHHHHHWGHHYRPWHHHHRHW